MVIISKEYLITAKVKVCDTHLNKYIKYERKTKENRNTKIAIKK